MRAVFTLLILMTGWVVSDPASAFDCARAAQPTDFVLCSSPKLLSAADEHAAAWTATMAVLDEADRKGLIYTQRFWARDVASLCDLPARGRPSPSEIGKAAGCVEWEFERRTLTLQKFTTIHTSTDSGIEHWSIPHYELFLHQEGFGDDRSIFWLLKDGHLVYLTGNAAIDINPRHSFEQVDDYKQSIRPVHIGEDILGLGRPTLLVEGNSRGAHCCLELTVLVLGAEFQTLPRMNLLDNESVQVMPRPGKPSSLEFRDLIWGYWRSSFAGSSSPEVILSYDGQQGRFAADADQMRRPAPTPDEFSALLTTAKVTAAEGDNLPNSVPRDITEPILDMIYSGHMQRAHEFLLEAWPRDKEGREDYWVDLTTCQLRLSAHWPTIAALNNLAADRPVGPCPRPAKF